MFADLSDRGALSKSGPDDHQHDLALLNSLSPLDEVPNESVSLLPARRRWDRYRLNVRRSDDLR
jgi:hypothetical protein